MCEVEQFLNRTYNETAQINSLKDLVMTSKALDKINIIAEKEETMKGVFTVLYTSLVYKSLHPSQDIRLHQANRDGGYNRKSFDTKYITLIS